MKQVKRSHQPTPAQMLRMASNLNEKYDEYSCVKVESRSSHSKGLEYTIYVANAYNHLYFDSWRKLQDKYFQLMKGSS